MFMQIVLLGPIEDYENIFPSNCENIFIIGKFLTVLLIGFHEGKYIRIAGNIRN